MADQAVNDLGPVGRAGLSGRRSDEEKIMGKVITSASMSLDGYISGPDESGFEHLFGWHHNGDVEVSATDPRWSFTTTEPSAEHLREQMAATGALVVGRRLFDVTQGWGGNHPFGVPVFVVTHQVPRDRPHPRAPFTSPVPRSFSAPRASSRQRASPTCDTG
jgi:dihydrofolate reductase